MGPAGDWGVAKHCEDYPLGGVDVEHANVIKSYVLSACEDLVISATVDDEEIVLVPIFKNCSAMENSGTRWSPRKILYSSHLK